jgi:hypothetical protein
MSEMPFQFTGNQVAGNDTAGFAIDYNHIQHFVAAVHLYVAQTYLPFQRLIRTQQQLLTGLAGGVESTLNLGSAK